MKTKIVINKHSFLSTSYYVFVNCTSENSYLDCWIKLTENFQKGIMKPATSLINGLTKGYAVIKMIKLKLAFEQFGSRYKLSFLLNDEIRFNI